MGFRLLLRIPGMPRYTVAPRISIMRSRFDDSVKQRLSLFHLSASPIKMRRCLAGPCCFWCGRFTSVENSFVTALAIVVSWTWIKPPLTMS